MGDWLIQFGIALIAGAVVGIAANLWVGAYALVIGCLTFFAGTRYNSAKRRPGRPRKK
jgi:uncharacterized membrane protein YoaK (UPF0700 family)